MDLITLLRRIIGLKLHGVDNLFKGHLDIQVNPISVLVRLELLAI